MPQSQEEQFQIHQQAMDAIRDILFMYKTLVEYFGIFDDLGSDGGKFDPMIFVDCIAADYDIDEEDAQLLQQGSAIKMLCRVYQAWGQQSFPKYDSEATKEARQVLEQGRLKHMPLLEEVMSLALADIKQAETRFDEVYKECVLGYFKQLATGYELSAAIGNKNQ